MISREAEIRHRDLLEKRPGDQVRDHDADDAQQRHVEPDRSQGEVYHQEIDRDRPEARLTRPVKKLRAALSGSGRANAVRKPPTTKPAISTPR